MRSFAVHLILIGLLNITLANIAQAQKASNSLPIDTFYFKFVKSSHFKIKLPKIEDSTVYDDLFNTYGKLSRVKIKGKLRQFLGDFKNVSRAKYVNGVLNKAGITGTRITLFDIWVPPVIKKKAPKVASQTAIVDETNAKSKFKRRGKNKNQANVNSKKKTNPFPARPKNVTDTNKAKSTKVENNNVAVTKTENVVAKKSPGKKTVDPKVAKVNVDNKKKDSNKIDNTKAKKTETNKYILILPKVTNPEVYQFVLKDLGTVDYKKLPNEQWYYYLGFFNDKEAAKTIIPKIKERGFNSPAKITDINNAEKIALTMYKGLPPIKLKKSTSTKKINSKKIDKTLFYRLELPPVSNPENYLKAFADIGSSYSEISPNGKGVYYIGEFQTADIAKAKADELKQRGLRNSVIVKFENDNRIDAYSEIYTKKEEEKETENVIGKEEEKEAFVKTHPKGNFQIRLKQVENPDVLKSVFEDVGKLKVGYLEDDTEYYFIGNYLFQKEAEKVIAQLKERGLTKFDLLNVMAADETPEKPANKVSTYKIKLGVLKNEQLNLFEPYGSISSINNEKTTEYYLGNYPTKKVANLILQELKTLKLEIPYEVKFFAE